jgi:hypothetical protein
METNHFANIRLQNYICPSSLFRKPILNGGSARKDQKQELDLLVEF